MACFAIFEMINTKFLSKEGLNDPIEIELIAKVVSVFDRLFLVEE